MNLRRDCILYIVDDIACVLYLRVNNWIVDFRNAGGVLLIRFDIRCI